MTRASVARWGIVAGVVIAFIVVPFAIWGGAVETWVEDWIASEHSPVATAGVIFGLLAADVLLPIPSSVVSVAAGMSLGGLAGTLAGALGMTVGCAVGHGLGRRLGRPGLQRFVDAGDMERFDTFVARFGDAAVLVTRAVPVLAEASVIMAGAARMPWPRFLAVCAIANLIVSAIYATVGDVAVQTDRVELAVLAALVLPGLAILASRIYLRRRRTR